MMILGVDPGPNPGVVFMSVYTGIVGDLVVHGNPLVALPLADWVAVERFIVGNATVRRTRAGSNETMAQAVAVHDAARAAGKPVQYLPAGQVKPWATDDKLRRYGVYGQGLTVHQRDAVRHALYMAVKHGALPVLA